MLFCCRCCNNAESPVCHPWSGPHKAASSTQPFSCRAHPLPRCPSYRVFHHRRFVFRRDWRVVLRGFRRSLSLSSAICQLFRIDLVINHGELLICCKPAHHRLVGIAFDEPTTCHCVLRFDFAVRVYETRPSSSFASSWTAACVKNMERVERRTFAAASTRCSKLSGRLN